MIYHSASPEKYIFILAAIWKTYSVAGQTQIIWQDPLNHGWKAQTPYRFFLKHRPQTGVINLQIYEGSVKIVDSGDVVDFGLSGGRVGVFTCSQDSEIWSDMSYLCQD